MKTIYSIFLFLVTTGWSLAFVMPMSLSEQVEKANAILRIVVVQVTDLEFNEEESWEFKSLAKCRIVSDYLRSHDEREFVYIPCGYGFDEDPSPLLEGDDCFVFLEAMKVSPLGHPVGFPGVFHIEKRRVFDPKSGEKGADVSVAQFEARIEELIEGKKTR